MSDQQIDAYIESTKALIAEYGWAVQGVGAGDGAPQFSYSVGFTALGHAEVIIESLPMAAAQGVLNNIGQVIKDGLRLAPGDVVRGFLGNDLPLAFIAAEDDSDLTVVGRIYGEKNALQAVWPDTSARFPWDKGYDMPQGSQPLLGASPEAFREITLS
ncbi:hypothetical protein GCM10025867_50070 (plasmid) [Frondihabitans sucicola]|uniref:DUF4262 domain-containing protein n=1 Tax=Frondihabitans sucicola TaxID=1268041 RepID=A0ABN6Y6H0_9MICO|nr:DUF4262 domain-containing protein [Frondihabitans sucicola]BDZ52766.1 hypothetical protein GCM10025867_50070 [Frondihabitans sucicola]